MTAKEAKNEESMRVVVRVRPENSRECKKSSETNEENPLISILDEQVLVFDPKVETAPTYFHGKAVKLRDITKRKQKDFKCVFDTVLDQFSTQQEVYEASALEVVSSVVNGYNGSVFAYGATGAGKTHSMLGSVDQPGVIYRTMVDLFKLMEEKEDTVFELSVSYLEIYNEAIRDLFSPSNPQLPLREAESGGVVISGLTYYSPKSVRELYDMLLRGNQNRTQHPTDANAQSSRSHAVFQVYLRQRPVNSGTTTQFSLSKLSLIDLAGSERAIVTANQGARMREGANINKSLLALGSCINALAENKTKHVPWRNSKLTRILKDCLGRNCKTCMIAAISPSRLTYEDTFNTLTYALRAKSIKSQLKKEMINVTEHVGKYQSIIENLKAENQRLQTQVDTLAKEMQDMRDNAEKSSSQSSGARPRSNSCGQNVESRAAVKELLSKIKAIHSKRASIRKSMLAVESEEKQLKMTRYFVTQMRKLVDVFSAVESEKQRRFQWLDLKGEELDKRARSLQLQKDNLSVKMATVEKEFSLVWGDVAMCESPEESDFLSKELHIRKQMIEIDDLKHQNQHLKNLTERQQNHNSRQSSRLIVIAQFLKTFFVDMRAEQSLSEDCEHSDKFNDLQCNVLDAICDLENELTSDATIEDLNNDEEPDELAGENFQKLLDFTMLKPISPTTPALPQNPVCTTPFTGGKISHNSRTAVKKTFSKTVASKLLPTTEDTPTNSNRDNSASLQATITKKRKPPSILTPKETPQCKQPLTSRSVNSRILEKTGRLFNHSGSTVKKTADSNLDRTGSSVVQRNMGNRVFKKPISVSETNSRLRSSPANSSMAKSGLITSKTVSTTKSSTSVSASSRVPTLGNNPQEKRFKKSVSSSVMPMVRQGLKPAASKSARSCSRRRSKTPSPVAARKDVFFKSKQKRGDTYTKADIERMLQSRELDDEFKENNRRCTVAAPSQITRHLSNSSQVFTKREPNRRPLNETFEAGEDATFVGECKLEKSAEITALSPVFTQNAKPLRDTKLHLLPSESVDSAADDEPSMDINRRTTVFGTSHFKSQSVANAVAKYRRATILKMNTSNN